MIVAGLGFSSRASLDSLRSAYDSATADYSVDALATIADKAGHPALEALLETLELPLHLIEARELAPIATMTQSLHSQAAHGTGSVAEASALAAVGVGARLLSPRHISSDRLATCAVAQGAST